MSDDLTPEAQRLQDTIRKIAARRTAGTNRPIWIGSDPAGAPVTPAEHYAEAERLLAEAASAYPPAHTYRVALVAEAQVHATLATAPAPASSMSPGPPTVFGMTLDELAAVDDDTAANLIGIIEGHFGRPGHIAPAAETMLAARALAVLKGRGGGS